MAGAVTLHSLPIFVRLQGRAVILVGTGDAANAKRRLLERAGASVVGEDADAALAIVVDDEPAAWRLRGRGVLVNVVDRPELCDFTLPAIVDRDPVIVAVGTGGVSAGLAAALRQRLEALLPADLGRLAEELHAMRTALRERFQDAVERRRVIADMIGDPLRHPGLVPGQAAELGRRQAAHKDELAPEQVRGDEGVRIVRLTSDDPDDLTLRQARWLANADRVVHRADVPSAILDRARADAARVEWDSDAVMPAPGLTVTVERA